MTRIELLEVATSLHFLPSTIDDKQLAVISNSIADDFERLNWFNKDTMTKNV